MALITFIPENGKESTVPSGYALDEWSSHEEAVAAIRSAVAGVPAAFSLPSGSMYVRLATSAEEARRRGFVSDVREVLAGTYLDTSDISDDLPND